MKIIAHIYTDFPQKFGIPRQSGLVKDLMGKIVFEPPPKIKYEEFCVLQIMMVCWSCEKSCGRTNSFAME